MKVKEFVSPNNNGVLEQLYSRWEVGKATVYKRFAYLEISICKEGGESFIWSDDLDEMDRLDAHLKEGGLMDDFERKGQLATVSGGEIEEAPLPVEAIPEANEGDQMRQLIRVAQEKAAGLLIAENLITAQFKDNPDQLDPDLLEQVKATKEAIAPKSIDPKRYALNLLDQFRQGHLRTA